jgi:hypothetical protein
LRVDFDLDNTSKPKPVVGPDDLLLLLVQHWARDKSVFPTEDDRHDLATIMLFNAYTGGRPAEFVHASRGKASQDPLGEADKSSKLNCLPETTGKDYDDESDTGDGPRHDGDGFLDDDDPGFANYDPSDENMNMEASNDSGYCSDETDSLMNEDNCPSVDVDIDDSRQLIAQNADAPEVDEFGEARRKYKALCYEDVRIWIVQNPKRGERDLLAMEVSLRHHKGVDNKPKPYVSPLYP